MYSLVSLLYSEHRAKSFHILLIKKAGANRQNIALQMLFTLNLLHFIEFALVFIGARVIMLLEY